MYNYSKGKKKTFFRYKKTRLITMVDCHNRNVDSSSQEQNTSILRNLQTIHA